LVHDQQLEGLRVGFVRLALGQLLAAAQQRAVNEVERGRGSGPRRQSLGAQHLLAVDAQAQLPALASGVQGEAKQQVPLVDRGHGEVWNGSIGLQK